MNKQEFLAFSLPYGLKFILDKSMHVRTVTEIYPKTKQYIGHVREHGVIFNIDFIKPILHPLSDLTKEIEHKGERLVPIDYLWFDAIGTDDDCFSKYDFYEHIESGYVKLYPFCVAQKLIEWHFDICGLIEKDEAIDVNTLSENPYK